LFRPDSEHSCANRELVRADVAAEGEYLVDARRASDGDTNGID
jgi:hypothetical protein